MPLTFTNEDFDQAVAGNLVVKVIYLPDRDNQDFASVAGAEELVSTRLAPGDDPVAEAQRRGTILAIIRLGNIDLENRASPAMNAPPPGGPMMLPPGCDAAGHDSRDSAGTGRCRPGRCPCRRLFRRPRRRRAVCRHPCRRSSSDSCRLRAGTHKPTDHAVRGLFL